MTVKTRDFVFFLLLFCCCCFPMNKQHLVEMFTKSKMQDAPFSFLSEKGYIIAKSYDFITVN